MLVVLTGCHSVSDRQRAAAGEIDDRAPVQAAGQITIPAPVAKVWSLMTDIERWPDWQPDIRRTSIAQKLSVGTIFRWSTGSGHIRSRVALLDPQRRLAWTGRLLIFRAIHVWKFQSLPGGRTFVVTRESIAGWPIGWLYSSRDLVEADRRWLERLKRRAET